MELNASMMHINMPLACGLTETPLQGKWKNNAPTLRNFQIDLDETKDVIDTNGKIKNIEENLTPKKIASETQICSSCCLPEMQMLGIRENNPPPVGNNGNTPIKKNGG